MSRIEESVAKYDFKLAGALRRMMDRYQDGRGVRLDAEELMAVMDSCLYDQATDIIGKNEKGKQ